MMDYQEAIRSREDDPRLLEELYRAAEVDGSESGFAAAIETLHHEAPQDALLAAWHYRLQSTYGPQIVERAVDWMVVLPIALLAGTVCAVLALPSLDFPDGLPYVLLVWSLVGSIAIAAYLAIAGRDGRAVLSAMAIALSGGIYVTLVSRLAIDGRWTPDYRTLMTIHVPVVAVAAIAVKVLSSRRDLTDRFAFLLKAIEVCVVGGVFVVVGGIFGAITLGLFEAIGVAFPDLLARSAIAAGGGAITVLSVAVVYDPRLRPATQRTQEGLGRIVRTMFRLLLPPALVVLTIYLVLIPFNFMVPFESREVLIVYNVMLFAVVGLLLGATPLRRDDLRERQRCWLRAGTIVVAILAVVVSIYALSATAYRTAEGGLTVNRLTVIGWNVINIVLLVVLAARALRRPRDWVAGVQSAFLQGAIVYVAWTAFLILAIPWLFR